MQIKAPTIQALDGNHALEYSVYFCPRILFRELKRGALCNVKELGELACQDLLVVPTFQPTFVDMLNFSAESEEAKEKCLSLVNIQRRLKSSPEKEEGDGEKILEARSEIEKSQSKFFFFFIPSPCPVFKMG